MANHGQTYRMSLSELLNDIIPIDGDQDREISGISMDSRTVKPGDIFIGIPGVNSDGRQFISSALENGASAILIEKGSQFDIPATDVPVLALNEVRNHIGLIVNRFYRFPSKRMKVIGITGTNGKTTCTQLLSRVLDTPEQRCAVIGTLGNGYPDSLDRGTHTTPDIVSLHRLIAEFAEQGAGIVCIEVSSHALEQDRVAGIHFDIAVFTNLTRDHLDYHGDMESYAAAKAKLFSVADLEYAILNINDAFGKKLSGLIKEARVIEFGIGAGDVRAEEIQSEQDGMSMTLFIDENQFPVRTHLYGEFNVSNLLAVASVLKTLNWTGDRIAEALSALTPVAGRMEQFGGVSTLPVVVVDYAHTPDALQHALTALRPHTKGELWCVFGCGGDRDRGKRALMGAVANNLADQIVLTDDNPRNEQPEKIISEIGQTISRPYLVIQPREKAVRDVLTKAAASDLVLLAGKGHEDYQEIGNKRFHYSDRELVQEIFGEVA